MLETFKKQLEEIIAKYESALSQQTFPRTAISDIKTRCIAAIARISGENSQYFRQVEKFDR